MEMEIYARKNQISCIWRDIQTFKSSYNYKLAPLIGTSFGQPLYDKLRVTPAEMESYISNENSEASTALIQTLILHFDGTIQDTCEP